MRWQDSEQTLDALASEYVLGTLSGRARKRFESVMRSPTTAGRKAAGYVASWQNHLSPIAAELKPVKPRNALWEQIDQATQARPVVKGERAAGHGAQSGSSNTWLGWLSKLFSPVPMGALAMGLMLGLLTPKLLGLVEGPSMTTQLPESYVGVLATREGDTGLIISSQRKGQILDVKRVAPVPVASGQTLYLWTLDAQGKAEPIGPFAQADFVSVALPKASEDLFFRAKELAVSSEPIGANPSQPSGTFLYRGLCGKLWRVPPKNKP